MRALPCFTLNLIKLGPELNLNRFKSAVDKVGASLTEDTLRRLESESVNVFRLNNAMVSEIGVRSRWWCLLMLLFVAAAALVGSVCELGPSLVGL